MCFICTTLRERKRSLLGFLNVGKGIYLVLTFHFLFPLKSAPCLARIATIMPEDRNNTNC